MSPGSHGSGSPVEDESKIGIAKITAHEGNHGITGASQSYLASQRATNGNNAERNSIKLVDREKKQVIYRKSPSPPQTGASDMPKKFFRLGGGKNGVIRLSPSPPP